MSDTAAHLVDDVLPEVPARQWVCSLPWRLRILLGYDRRLCAEVMSAFTGAVSRSLRHRAKAQLGLPSVDDAHVGAVTFIQRSDSALRLNVHAHSLFLDGVYVRDSIGALAFHALGVPTFEEVEQVAQWTHTHIIKILLGTAASSTDPAMSRRSSCTISRSSPRVSRRPQATYSCSATTPVNRRSSSCSLCAPCVQRRARSRSSAA